MAPPSHTTQPSASTLKDPAAPAAVTVDGPTTIFWRILKGDAPGYAVLEMSVWRILLSCLIRLKVTTMETFGGEGGVLGHQSQNPGDPGGRSSCSR